MKWFSTFYESLGDTQLLDVSMLEAVGAPSFAAGRLRSATSYHDNLVHPTSPVIHTLIN